MLLGFGEVGIDESRLPAKIASRQRLILILWFLLPGLTVVLALFVFGVIRYEFEFGTITRDLLQRDADDTVFLVGFYAWFGSFQYFLDADG